MVHIAFKCMHDFKYNRFFRYFLLLFLIALSSGCSKNKSYAEQAFNTRYKQADIVTTNSQTGIWNDATNRITRTDLYALKTSGVPSDTYNLVLAGLNKFIQETGRSVTVIRYDSPIPDGYNSADWYQEQAMTDSDHGHGIQADGSKIIALLSTANSSNDHFIVLITDADLNSGEVGNNFVFGLSNYPYIVISARRFLDWKRIRFQDYDAATYDQAISLVAAHEFGHYLDLTQRNFNVWSGTNTLLDNHCKGQNGFCLMQQMNVDVEGCNSALEQAKLIFGREHWLCPDCAAEIYFRKQALINAGFVW
jgi:predicted Zn-dependent protease